MKKETKIQYLLPDFLWTTRNEMFIELYKNHPEVIREDTSIYSFYGTFPNAIWNGGSIVTDIANASVLYMKKIRDFYNKRGFVITFTFTNTLIEEKHLHDEYCNKILEIFHNGKNEVLVANELLEQYIRKNYPKYKINRSIINTEKIPFLSDNYNLSVVSKFKNKDFKFLNSLSKEDRNKAELLCDEQCVSRCPYAYKHYKEYAYIQLNGRAPENCDINYGNCRFKNNPYEFYKKRYFESEYRISYEDIVNTYVPLGFKYFKLSGRGIFNFGTFEIWIEYMIKPEYQVDVRTYMKEVILNEVANSIKERLIKDENYSFSVENNGWRYL